MSLICFSPVFVGWLSLNEKSSFYDSFKVLNNEYQHGKIIALAANLDEIDNAIYEINPKGLANPTHTHTYLKDISIKNPILVYILVCNYTLDIIMLSGALGKLSFAKGAYMAVNAE